MNINIIKYLIISILTSLILFFSSCNVYEISWRNYSTYSDEKIILTFQNNEKINLKLDRTREFRLFTPIERIIGFERQYGCYIYVYPFFSTGIESEIFFYNIDIISQNEKSINILPRNNIEAYYAEFYIDDYCYTVISKSNVLTITEHQELKNMEDILLFIQSGAYTYVSAGKPNYNGIVICGYIVRSNIDRSIRVLKSEI